MSYLVIDDFRLGMDRRKKRVSGAPGALWDGINGHINRGGDFERRKKFVSKFVLPTGLTQGCAQLFGQLFVFGSGDSPAGLPGGVNYQKLAHTSSATLTQILDVTSFGGKLYAVAAFDNGDIYHYYDGSRVTDWDTLAASIASNNTIATALAAKISLDPRYLASAVGSVITISAAIAGTAFTVAATAINHGGTDDQTLALAVVQANVAAVAETRATMTVQFLSGFEHLGALDRTSALNAFKINSELITSPTRFSWRTDNAITADAFALAVNTMSVTSGFTAESDHVDTVTISAPVGLGATPNAYTFTTGLLYGMSIKVNGAVYSAAADDGNAGFVPIAASMSGGVAAVPAVAQVETATVAGTFDNTDVWTITLDGTAYITTSLASGMGKTALSYQSKEYSVTTSLLVFSAVGDPTKVTSGTGFGQINMTTQNDDNEALVGAQQYQNRISVFSRDNIQIWVIAVDPTQNTFQQSVQNTGALSNRSIQQYGNIDVFYLNDSGVRSIRARDASNAPAVNDVGVAIDTFIQEHIATLSGTQIGRAPSVIEPLDGRYMLALNNRIYAYSFFPGSKISAWTYYDLTDEIGTADITEMVKARNRIYLRAADTIYLYGGDDNATYPDDDEIEATCSIPFLSASKPATTKGITAFDAACTGVWQAKLLPEPQDDTLELDIGTFDGTTLSPNTQIPIEHPGQLFAVKMTCNKAGPATISKMILHFNTEGET